jgi:HAD superfamily hydrolase (TIGR01484 family)
VIPSHVQPWERCDAATLRRVRGVLTDIDDTLTTEGALTMGAVAAIAALRASGLPVIAVTGRPMGWSVRVVEGTTLSAVVAENGAVALMRRERGDPGAAGGNDDGSASDSHRANDIDSGSDEVVVEYAQDEAVRRANAERLHAVAARILAEVPGATLARDSAGRVTDIAIDHAEFAHLDDAAIARVVAIMESAGMHATVSSIHVNGWFGEHSKRTGARWIVQRLLGRDLDAERDDWLYVGDSTNDEPMFAAFALSVGVANIVDFAARLQRWPAYVTRLDRGRGFVEIAEALLAARAG